MPEAVFISNNLLALGALLEMGNHHLNCRNDLGIVCFDDHPWAGVSNPPLTVIRQPTRRIGQIAAEMILALINDQPIPQKEVILDCELVVRQSCRPLHNPNNALPERALHPSLEMESDGDSGYHAEEG
jgi:DNA-binding LacI/PurR family transcriptional regulator